MLPLAFWLHPEKMETRFANTKALLGETQWPGINSAFPQMPILTSSSLRESWDSSSGILTSTAGLGTDRGLCLPRSLGAAASQLVGCVLEGPPRHRRQLVLQRGTVQAAGRGTQANARTVLSSQLTLERASLKFSVMFSTFLGALIFRKKGNIPKVSPPE